MSALSQVWMLTPLSQRSKSCFTSVKDGPYKEIDLTAKDEALLCLVRPY